MSDLSKARALLAGPIEVVHLGIESVSRAPEAGGARVTRVPFLPPAGGDPARIDALRALLSAPLGPAIDEANERALARFLESRPHLAGIGVARETIPGMDGDLFLHAGPPVAWERMCGPLRGAVIGGLLLEGRAKSAEEAGRIAASGAVRFEPCHHLRAVGPMAGLITPSMPVWIVEDAEGAGRGNRAFCTLNEGLGKVLRYGAFSGEVIERLRYMADDL
ncbi:MAG: DUF1116 domain-containing protein, partial [Candidatus Eisenbacteria bacterium]